MSANHRKLNRRIWDAVRVRALESAEYQCERCGFPGRLEVHHKVSLQIGGEPYDESNLEVLCRTCHIAESGHVPVRGKAEWWDRLRHAIS